MSTDEFISRAKTIHGEKYCYDKVNYKDKNTKVEIICPIHGSFWQKPVLHLQPAFQCGCPKCASESISDSNRLNTDVIKNRIREKFGEYYDLSLVEYGKTVHDPITIICPKHGKFDITPWYINFRQNLCLKCYKENEQQKQLDKFLIKAKEIHGSKFDYSKVKYINTNTPVDIICPIHGLFKQRPSDHLRGKGCNKCYQSSKPLKTEDFIEKAKIIWGDKWDYSQTICNGRRSNVLIICKKHGHFTQSAHNHLNGYIGCKKCQRENGYFQTPRTPDEFIKAARNIHGNEFDYSLVKGDCSMTTQVNIICKKHGAFKQQVANHLAGHGCRKCRNAQQEKIVRVALEKRRIEYEEEKIFKWLKRKGYLKLDFYLPKYNIAIEAQGAMHFGIHKTNKFTMNDADYKDLFDRDRIKYKLCKEHGIRVLYFCYNKEWIPDKYIDKVYSTIKELIEEIRKTKPP